MIDEQMYYEWIAECEYQDWLSSEAEKLKEVL